MKQMVAALAACHAPRLRAAQSRLGNSVRVREGDRLCYLHVGEAGHDGVGVFLGQVGQRAAQGVFDVGTGHFDDLADQRVTVGVRAGRWQGEQV